MAYALRAGEPPAPGSVRGAGSPAPGRKPHRHRSCSVAVGFPPAAASAHAPATLATPDTRPAVTGPTPLGGPQMLPPPPTSSPKTPLSRRLVLPAQTSPLP